MAISFIIFLVLIFSIVGFCISYMRARFLERSGFKMHSRAHYYGWWTFLITIIPALIFLIFWNGGSSAYLEYIVSRELEAHMVSMIEIDNHELTRKLIKMIPHFKEAPT
ncbi:MAG: phosphate ABC transporter permease family protein, partial [Bartonella sp.]|nr:phosphate ABC transporter permease family protein [Bartonella sp.]